MLFCLMLYNFVIFVFISGANLLFEVENEVHKSCCLEIYYQVKHSYYDCLIQRWVGCVVDFTDLSID